MDQSRNAQSVVAAQGLRILPNAGTQAPNDKA